MDKIDPNTATDLSSGSQTSSSEEEHPQSPPPQGDQKKAEKYLSKLTDLIRRDKITVVHTDLNKFNLESIQDHYQIDLKDYEVEVSHSKHPDSNQNFYVMVFNNIKQVKDGCAEKIILAYINLTENQFREFKTSCESLLEKKRQEEEQKRFQEALQPVDSILGDLSDHSANTSN